MKTYYITPRRVRELHGRVMFKDGAETIEFDYDAWAQANAALTGVTVSVEYGKADVSNESLSDNVKSMLVTTANAGWSLLKLVATDGTNKDVQYLEIVSEDPPRQVSTQGIC